jgi:hypothetical protein
MMGRTVTLNFLESWEAGIRGILRPFAKPIRTNYSNAAGLMRHFLQRALPESLEVTLEESFQERLRLVQAINAEQFPSLYEAIFDSWEDEEGHVIDDGGPPRAGAPDLFVWHSQPGLPAWFLCEVKAYGDYLEIEQYVWLRQWWRVIGGRYLLLLVDPTS